MPRFFAPSFLFDLELRFLAWYSVRNACEECLEARCGMQIDFGRMSWQMPHFWVGPPIRVALRVRRRLTWLERSRHFPPNRSASSACQSRRTGMARWQTWATASLPAYPLSGPSARRGELGRTSRSVWKACTFEDVDARWLLAPQCGRFHTATQKSSLSARIYPLLGASVRSACKSSTPSSMHDIPALRKRQPNMDF